MSADSISLIIGIVSAILGLVSFFAAIIFFINGSRLNRQSEKILSNIDSKVNLIQEHYGKVIDRSFDMTKDNILSLSKQLFSQLNVLEDSLRDVIKAKLISFDQITSDQVRDHNLEQFRRLENDIEKVVEDKLGEIKKAAEKIIHLSGKDYKSDYIKWRFLKALQYGAGNNQTVQKYFRSYAIDFTNDDILFVASKLLNEGLIENDIEFTEKAKKVNSHINDPYWRLTDTGQRAMRREYNE